MSEIKTASNWSPAGNCKFAIPKKGRLYEKCVATLKGAGIEFQREHRLDVALCKDLPITLVFLPAADIAKYVGEGNIDLGITGLDVVKESNVDVDHVMDLNFGGCRLCLQAPVTNNIKSGEELAGKRIVTSFPELAKEFFKPYDEKKGVQTKVKFVSGSVEAACGLGLADGIVDLVETGTTMKAAGLEIVEEVLSTQAILISNKHSEHSDLVELIKNRVEGFITANTYSMIMYNASEDILQTVLKITPGKRSPTITSLDDGGKAVSSLIKKKEIVKIMDDLSAAGATDILVLDLSNSRIS